MWQQIFMGAVGLCAGMIVASGAVGLLIGLSIIPRYAGITRTAFRILLYEDFTMLGAVFGTLLSVFDLSLPFGNPGLALFGLFSGIFLGSWILALAEMADVIPILSRRIRFTHGLPKVIFSVALGKTLGSLVFFYLGWHL